MQPRKSSAFSSLPDAAAPLDLTDLAICLKYLKSWCNSLSHTFGMHFNKHLQSLMHLRFISFYNRQLLCDLPAHSSESTDFIQLLTGFRNWNIVIVIPRVEKNNFSVRKTDCSRSEEHLLIHLTICPDGEGHCERHQCHCGKQSHLKAMSQLHYNWWLQIWNFQF